MDDFHVFYQDEIKNMSKQVHENIFSKLSYFEIFDTSKICGEKPYSSFSRDFLKEVGKSTRDVESDVKKTVLENLKDSGYPVEKLHNEYDIGGGDYICVTPTSFKEFVLFAKNYQKNYKKANQSFWDWLF